MIETATLNSSTPDPLFFFGHGETYHFTRQMDWRNHPLGEPWSWPQELKSILSLLFHCQQPMFLFWGSDCFCFYNDAYVPLLGSNLHPMSIGRKAEELWPEIWNDCCAPQLKLVLKHGTPISRFDENLVLQKGSRLEEAYFNYSLSPVYLADGRIGGALAISIETTEKVLSTRSRNESESRLKLALKSARMGVWSVDLSTGRAELSSEMADFLGFKTQEQNVYMLLEQLVYPEDLDRVKMEFQNCVTQKRPLRSEFRSLRSDGQLRWVSVTGNIQFHPENRPASIEGVIMDIHEQKVAHVQLARAKAEAESANESKSSFLANMSHEIRTPLTAVLGFAELLRDELMSSEERQSSIGRIERSGQALLKLIDNILDLSKIEAGQLTVHRESFSPKEVVAEVVGLLRPTANHKDLCLRMEVDPSVPVRVLSDPGCVRQVILNLIGNAIKFTDQGYVEVRVSMEDKCFLKIEVIDSGIGISKESQSRLFQAFSQADDSITRQFGGTGLGLALSRRLCESLGGTLVLAESEYSKGSRFVARFEAIEDTSESAIKSLGKKKLTAESADGSLQGLRILVAEDGVDNKALFKLYLEPTGADLTIVSDGNEAYVKAKSGNFDIVLMDVQMPGMDGLQATRQLRKIGYEGPIVALTAHAMKEEVRRSLEAGCNAHLNKPITRTQLIHAVREYAIGYKNP